MDRRKEKIERIILPAQLVILSALCGYMVFLAYTTPYSIDDFCFVTYPQDGLRQFILNLIDHYRIYNGRTYLHWLLSLELYMGKWVFPVLAVMMMLLIPFILWKTILLADRRSDSWMSGMIPEKTGYLSCAVLCSALFLAMPPVMKTDGVLWQSGYFNYIMPIPVFLYMLYLLIKMEKEERYLRLPQVLWLCFISFLTGSSTEQFGFPAICMAVCFLLRSLQDQTEKKSVYVLSILSTAAGILLILLSPSMRNRMEREQIVSDLGGNLVRMLRDQAGFFMEDLTFLLLLSFVVLLTAYLFFYNENQDIFRFRKTGIGVLILDTVLITLSWFLLINKAQVASYVICLFTLACTGFRLVIEMELRYVLRGILLLSSFVACVVVFPSQSYGSRLIVPMYMFLSFLLAVCAADFPFLSCTLQAAVFVLSTLLMVWTFPHYMYNYRMEIRNEQFREELKTTHELWYNVDYDKDYTRDKIDRGGIYLQGYLKQAGFDSRTDKLYVYSRKYPGILYRGERLSWYALWLNGKYCLPIRYVVEEAGGRVVWNSEKDSVEFHLNGVVYQYSEEYLEWTDEKGHHRIFVKDTQKDLEVSYFPRDVAEEAFGLDVALTYDLPPGK